MCNHLARRVQCFPHTQTRFPFQKLYVFLFQDILVLTRPVTRNERQSYQVYRQPIPVQELLLEDLQDGDVKMGGSFRGAFGNSDKGTNQRNPSVWGLFEDKRVCPGMDPYGIHHSDVTAELCSVVSGGHKLLYGALQSVLRLENIQCISAGDFWKGGNVGEMLNAFPEAKQGRLGRLSNNGI